MDSPNQPIRLLLIDDDEVQLKLHARVMQKFGYDVIPLKIDSDNIIGMVKRKIDEFRPDAVLTDWQLNDHMDGALIARKMYMQAEFGKMPAIPMVLHTSNLDEYNKNVNSRTHDASESGLLGALQKGGCEEVHALFSSYFSKHPRPDYAAVEAPSRDSRALR